jgi:hypothetical protein
MEFATMEGRSRPDIPVVIMLRRVSGFGWASQLQLESRHQWRDPLGLVRLS